MLFRSRILTDSSSRLDVLVSRFLELARAESGLTGEQRGRLDLGELVRGVVGTFAGDDRHATVRFEVETLPVPVTAVSERIETALRNIIENAVSFAGREGVVKVRLVREGRDARIDVTDSGPGIAPEDLPRIFDRFFTRRPVGKGTGLGLALVKAIVEAHGGRVAASSVKGEGATFTVWLPGEEQPAGS